MSAAAADLTLVVAELDGVNILTDPIWNDRASPVHFAGPRRLVPPGLRFEDLPRIHAAIISHDHYDHWTFRRCSAWLGSTGRASSCRLASGSGWLGAECPTWSNWTGGRRRNSKV